MGPLIFKLPMVDDLWPVTYFMMTPGEPHLSLDGPWWARIHNFWWSPNSMDVRVPEISGNPEIENIPLILSFSCYFWHKTPDFLKSWSTTLTCMKQSNLSPGEPQQSNLSSGDAWWPSISPVRPNEPSLCPGDPWWPPKSYNIPWLAKSESWWARGGEGGYSDFGTYAYYWVLGILSGR